MRTTTRELRKPFVGWGVLALGILLGVCSSSQAVVDGNSQTNTSPPADGAPWASTGSVNGGGGVYLGSGWVLTVAHIGAGTTTFSGTPFSWDGTSYRLTNSDGTATDLVLFHLSDTPPLPNLGMASNSPAGLSQVDMIGFGAKAGSSQTMIGAYTGFYWSPGGGKSWGNNKVNAGGTVVINAGLGDLTTFVTDFTTPGTPGPTAPTSDECQAAGGDSGGGVYQLNGSTWQLVGILDAIDSLPNQPANTAVYGNSTYSADVATYRPQIIQLARPALSISRFGTNVQICWPDMAAGFTLESTPVISPASWTTVVSNVATTNGTGCALLPPTGSAKFFRLRKP